ISVITLSFSVGFCRIKAVEDCVTSVMKKFFASFFIVYAIWWLMLSLKFDISLTWLILANHPWIWVGIVRLGLD
ncbi:hypothetical protein, partial [Moraxella sp. TY6]